MKKNILIVDDDLRLRELLKDYLSEKNLDVYLCEDFEDAKEILAIIVFCGLVTNMQAVSMYN